MSKEQQKAAASAYRYIGYAKKVKQEAKLEKNFEYPFIVPFVHNQKILGIIQGTLDAYSAQIGAFNQPGDISKIKREILETQKALYEKLEEDLKGGDVEKLKLDKGCMKSMDGHVFYRPTRKEGLFCVVIPPFTANGINGNLFMGSGVGVKISEGSGGHVLEALTKKELREFESKNSTRTNHI